jgi:hypothetical protein
MQAADYERLGELKRKHVADLGYEVCVQWVDAGNAADAIEGDLEPGAREDIERALREAWDAYCGAMWAYGNGSIGCLYDHACGPYGSAREAADAAGELLELTDAERSELAEVHALYLSGDRRSEVGAEVVELFEVDASWLAAPSVRD